MKIYFAGSIRGGRNNIKSYEQIIEHLKIYGNVLTEHIGNTNLSKRGEIQKDKFIHDRDLNWLDECDVLVGEVSEPSLGVGYEIRYAIEKDKRILCLYKPKEDSMLSAMIAGNPNITNKNYNNINEAKKAIDEFMKSVNL